jgi:hypothetical protein
MPSDLRMQETGARRASPEHVLQVLCQAERVLLRIALTGGRFLEIIALSSQSRTLAGFLDHPAPEPAAPADRYNQ